MAAEPVPAPKAMETDDPVALTQGDEKTTSIEQGGQASDGKMEVKSESKPRKILLRFDNGTVARFKDLAAKEVEILRPEEALKAGLLGEEHLFRIQSYLCEVHAKLPEEGPLKSVSLGSKRSIDTVLEAGQFNSAKRTKSTGHVAPGGTPLTSPGDVTSRKNMDFTTIAKKLVHFLTNKVLDRRDSAIFQKRVDPNVVLDYYDIVEKPMAFEDISKKLDSNQYTSPKEFYDDVLQICDNCYVYNVVTHPSNVGTLGVKMENAFLKAWEKTPFAAKFPARPQRQMPRIPDVVPAPRPSSAGRGPARVNHSIKPKQTSKIYMTAEMENDLVTALNTPAILEANMEAVVEILTVANEMGVDEDGEPSLDLEKVTAPTKRKLYDLVVGKKESSTGAKPTSSGFKVEEDDDYDPEDEDM
jgi:hypothetical protein